MALLTVVRVSDRGPAPLLERPGLTQYAQLAEDIRGQTFRNWDLVVVDRLNPLPPPELADLGPRLTCVRAPATPWSLLGSWAAAAARDAGLRAATGTWVLGLDDCVGLPPRLLEVVAEFAVRGLGVAPVLANHREPAPTRCGTFPVEVAGGIVSYRRAAALAAGGHERRLDGCGGGEDTEFVARLVRLGHRFVADGRAFVRLHPHAPSTRRVLRCPHRVLEVLGPSTRANVPWTPAQRALLLAERCPFAGVDGACGLLPREACRLPGPVPAFVRGVVERFEASPFAG